MLLRRSIVAFAVSLLVVSSVAQTVSPPATPSMDSSRIAGMVVSALNGNPLPRARVTIGDTTNREQTSSVITSDDGRFEFNQLSRGKYSLRGAKRGFIAAGYLEHEQFSTAIVTGAGLDTEHLVLRLAPFAILSGKVLDEAGDTVRHATVSLYRENHRFGESRITRFRSVSTDDQGYYEFSGLDAGIYFISVQAAPWYAIHPSSIQNAGGATSAAVVDPSLDVAYPVTYYADSTEPDDAAPILLQGGDHLEVDIHLNPVPALHLQFPPPTDRTRGFAAPTLEKLSFDALEPVPNLVMEQAPDGGFELTGIAPGHYMVRIPTSQPDGSTQSSEMDIDLNGDNQKLDSSSGEASATVKATVQIAGESKIPPHLSIALRNSKMRIVAWQELNEKGQVTFPDVVPGRYEVLAQGPGKRYSVVRISSPSSEAQGHYVNVTAGASLAVSLSIVGGAVRVEGVAQRDGKPVSGVMVVLAPKDPESNRQLFRRDQSDLDGSFVLQSVIPGTYSVCAIENGWDLDWAKPATIAHYCEHGQKVTVRDNMGGESLRLPAPVETQLR